MGVCGNFRRDLFSEFTFFEWSGVDDGVDGSDVDTVDVGVDGDWDDIFKDWTLLKISGAGDGVDGNDGLAIEADPEGVTVTGVDGNDGIAIEADAEGVSVTDGGKTEDAVEGKSSLWK